MKNQLNTLDGCHAYFHVNNEQFNQRAKKVIFHGYASGVEGSIVWTARAKSRFRVSTNLAFDEKSMLHLRKESFVHPENENEKVVHKEMEFEVSLKRIPVSTPA